MQHGTARHDPTSDLLDSDGRPVGEIGSRLYDPSATELLGCPYADARHGRPMNHTALRQLSAAWPGVLAAARTLAGPGPATVHRAWRAVVAGTRAPAAHRTYVGGPIPRVLSALYKSSLGFSQVLTALLLAQDGMADVPLGSLGNADAFFALLDRERWLVGAEQVCAGPANLIGQMFDALQGAPARPSTVLDSLGNLEQWTDDRVAWVAVQVAHLGAVRELAAERGLDGSVWHTRVAVGLPCLRSVLAQPGRNAEHARRLFHSGDSPVVLERYLAARPTTLDGLEAHRDACLAPLSRR